MPRSFIPNLQAYEEQATALKKAKERSVKVPTSKDPTIINPWALESERPQPPPRPSRGGCSEKKAKSGDC